MTRTRILIFVTTLLVVGLLGVVMAFYARGFRLDSKNLRFIPNGLLVINSEPNGAQIFVNGELKTATNTTLSLTPGSYDISVKKEGFLDWQKRVVIEKEVVTSIDVVLFPAAPSLSPITFSGVTNIVPSSDFGKIAYVVPPTKGNLDRAGLWVTESTSLPIGFTREPKRVADGDFSNISLEWSPDSREILATTNTGAFLIDVGQFTPQSSRINVASQVKTIKASWQEKENKRQSTRLARLADEIEDVLKRKAKEIVFSPDENKILYTASGSASIPEGIAKQLPGASTQKQVRDIREGKKYIYDIKEDRNFEIADESQPVFWLTTSSHLILPQEGKIIIMDYDGTNAQTVYSGSYVAPHSYPYSNASKLLILTNLGSSDSLPNLYSLNLK